MRKNGKKLLSLLLALVMMLSLLPGAALAEGEGEPVTAELRVELIGVEGSLIPNSEVTVVPGVDTFESLGVAMPNGVPIEEPSVVTPLHFMAKYLVTHGTEVEKVHEVLDMTGGWLNNIDGHYGGGNWSFVVNNEMTGNETLTTYEVRQGDQIAVYAMGEDFSDAAHYVNRYAYFEQDTYHAVVGEPATLNLIGFSTVWGEDATPAPLEGATLLIDQDGAVTPTEHVTDANGNAAVTFDTPGTYVVSAVRDVDDQWISRPWCVVEVAEAPVPADTVTATLAINIRTIYEPGNEASPLPEPKEFTVHEGATLRDLLELAAEKQGWDLAWDGNLLTGIDWLSDIASINDRFYTEYGPQDFSYNGWTYLVDGEFDQSTGIGDQIVKEGSVYEFRYTLYATQDMHFYDWEFLEALDAAQAAVEKVRETVTSDMPSWQKAALEAEVTAVEEKIAELTESYAGLWIDYIAQVGIKLYGPGSDADALSRSVEKIEDLLSGSFVTNELTDLAVTTVTSTDPVPMDPAFSPDVTEYAVRDFINHLNTIKFKATASIGEAATIKVYQGDTLKADLTSGGKWETVNGLDWTSLTNTFRVVVSPPDDSGDRTYTVTVYRLLTEAEAVDRLSTDSTALDLPLTVTEDITLPAAGESGYTAITWSSGDPTVLTNEGQVKRGPEEETVTLTATLTIKIQAGSGIDSRTAEKQFIVTIPPWTDEEQEAAKLAQLDEAMAGISDSYATKDETWWSASYTGSWWDAMAISAYADYADQPVTISNESRQGYVNKAVASLTTDSTTEPTRVNKLQTAVMGLRALGYDPSKIVTVNKTEIDAPARLKTADLTTAYDSWYVTYATYTVLALRQGDYGSESVQKAHVDFILTKLAANQQFKDSYMMLLQGLAPFYETDERVKAAVDDGLTYLSSQQLETGSYGSVNTDAMLAILLAQLGIDPNSDARFVKNGKSLVDGLLSYVVEENGEVSTGTGLANSQGFMGLIAAAQVMRQDKAIDVYDFSSKPLESAVANGSGGSKPVDPPDTNDDINVSLTLKTDTSTWISRTRVTVKEGSTVYHAFVKLLDTKGYTYDGADSGYVHSITHPDDITLKEMDKGPNSGWLYKVNDELPDIPLTEYELTDGDSILWYYTTDWTEDPDAGKPVGGGSGGSKTDKTDSAAIQPAVTADKNGEAKAEVTAEELDAAVKQARADKLNVIVVEPKVKGEASKVSVTLPGGSLAAMVKDSSIQLRVKTAQANVTLSPAALEDLKLTAKTPLSVSFETLSAGAAQTKIEIKVGDRSMTDLKGGLSVSLPVEKPTSSTVLVQMTENGPKVLKWSAVSGETLHARLSGSATVMVKDNAKTFADVPADHWSNEAVTFAAAHELFQGVGGESFAPAQTMTAPMLKTVLARLSGGDDAWDAALPATPITRRDLAEAMQELAGGEGDAMTWASETKLLLGKENGELDPEGIATRAEVAAVLQRYITGITSNSI